jgi:hypothetical protein
MASRSVHQVAVIQRLPVSAPIFSIDQPPAFAFADVAFDEQGNPKDFRLTEADELFCKLTGKEPCQILGSSASEALSEAGMILLDRLGSAVQSHKREAFSIAASPFQCPVRVVAFPVGTSQVAIAVTEM